MQARLALALVLSFLVLVLWEARHPAPAEADGPANTDEPGVERGGPDFPDAGGETNGEPPPPVDEAPPWRETVRLGPYHATFDNRGAVLAELRLENYQEYRNEQGRLVQPDQGVAPSPVLLCREVDTGHEILASLALGTASKNSGGWTELDPASARWRAEVLDRRGDTASGVRFTLDGGRGIELEKTVRVAEGYDLAVDLVVRNTGAPALAGQTGLLKWTPAMGVPRAADDNFYVEPKAGVCWRKGKSDYGVAREERDHDDRKQDVFPPAEDIVWAGVDNKYFAVLLRPAEPEAQRGLIDPGWRTVWDAEWARAHPEDASGSSYRHIATDVALDARVPEEGESSTYGFLLYAGPKQRDIMGEHPQGDALAKLVSKDLGFFNGIASLLLGILGFFQGLVGNWGVAIILLTLTVRAALFPFNRRSQTAMGRHATKMKRIQPRLNEIKEKYAKDPRKQREEQARVMQEEGAFPPLGGCLPIFVQIPVFFGLFSALRVSFDLRQAPFAGWIHDLSEPDRFMRLGLGEFLMLDLEYLNVLPPLMVVLWIVQQRVMPKPTDEQAARMQKMMMWMPVLFGFFLYSYAAGLSLYMITTSAFGIVEQTVIKRIWPIDDREQPKKKGGFMNRIAKLQEQAQQMEQMKRQAKQQQQRQRGKRDRGKGGKGGKGGGKRRK